MIEYESELFGKTISEQAMIRAREYFIKEKFLHSQACIEMIQDESLKNAEYYGIKAIGYMQQNKETEAINCTSLTLNLEKNCISNLD